MTLSFIHLGNISTPIYLKQIYYVKIYQNTLFLIYIWLLGQIYTQILFKNSHFLFKNNPLYIYKAKNDYKFFNNNILFFPKGIILTHNHEDYSSAIKINQNTPFKDHQWNLSSKYNYTIEKKKIIIFHQKSPKNYYNKKSQNSYTIYKNLLNVSKT